MPANAAFLMRAYRTIDGSFHTWRAGEFDSDMSETTPPHPKPEYSDFVVLSHIGGPLARSDGDAFLLAGLGTPGVPVTFAIDTGPATVEGLPGTDCQDWSSISIWVVVTSVGTATQLRVSSLWSNIAAPTVGVDLGPQASDDAILAGISPQNPYKGTYPLAGLPAQALGPYNVPVRGRRHLVLVDTDTGDLDGYVLAMRFA